MAMAEIEVKRWGNSLGILLPKDIVRFNGLSEGDRIKVEIIKSKRIDGYGLFKGAPRFKEDEYEHGDLF